jgi:hypothetical protein
VEAGGPIALDVDNLSGWRGDRGFQSVAEVRKYGPRWFYLGILSLRRERHARRREESPPPPRLDGQTW